MKEKLSKRLLWKGIYFEGSWLCDQHEPKIEVQKSKCKNGEILISMATSILFHENKKVLEVKDKLCAMTLEAFVLIFFR